jgi:hypothetical protein
MGPIVLQVRAQQWLGLGGLRARLEFLPPSHNAIDWHLS